jgi:sugar lactone lactonase YvrE
MALPMRVFPITESVTTCVTGHPQLGEIKAWFVGNQVGESPVWCQAEDALFWIDVRAPQLLRLCTKSAMLTRWVLPDVVGALALAGTDNVLLALRHSLVQMSLLSGLIVELAAVETDRPDNRLNDGKVSPSGRWFVFGSMDDRPQKQATGSLYRAANDGKVEKLFDGLFVANGIAWKQDASEIYFSDSHRGLLMRAGWDESTGLMGQPSVVSQLNEVLGRPDGACVDANDGYWSAGVSAGVLNLIDTDGSVARRIDLPCQAPTMCTFGEADAQTMFVTSLVRPHWANPGRWDGALLSFKSPALGVFSSTFKIRT